MSIKIKAPTFPESVADGTIANWIKKEGEVINQDEVIVEIETDKVVLEVLAQSDGVISKILKTEGETIASSEIIGEFEESNGTSEIKNTDTEKKSKPKKEEKIKEEPQSKKANIDIIKCGGSNPFFRLDLPRKIENAYAKFLTQRMNSFYRNFNSRDNLITNTLGITYDIIGIKNSS